MKKSLLLAAVCLGAWAQAQDLESLLEGKSETQQTRNMSYLADSVRSILGSAKPEQNFLIRNLEKSEWIDALLSWDAAFGGTDFEKSDDGKALHALLLFRSGMTVAGLEELFAVAQPKKINFQILNSWRESATEAAPAWMVSRVEWKQDWIEIFGPALEIRKKSIELGNQKNIEELNALAMRAPMDSRERAVIDWNLAIAYALKDQADKSAKIVSSLLKAKNNPISTELLNISAARMLYQNGYFEASQKYYDKVPKSSEDYLEAQEEKAWGYLRRGQPQNALAVTQSLANPVLAGQVGPESWFLRALSQLKVCDYPGTLETLQQFPKLYKDRTLALDALAKDANTQDVDKAFAKMKVQKLTRADILKEFKNLPRNISRDEKLRYLLSQQAVLEKEADAAEAIFAKSLKLTGLQGQFDILHNRALERNSSAKSEARLRVQELAKDEVEETRKILNKMHIVETEVIQQVNSAKRLVKHLGGVPEIKLGTTGSQAQDTLKFPFEKEFWFDEITNYKVDIKKGCQARRSE